MKMEIPSQTAGAGGGGGGGGGWERSWIGGALMEEQNRLLMALEVLVLVVLVLRVHVHVIAVMVDDYEVGGDYVVGYYEEKALARLIRLAVV